jgi:hypothetical protein
VNWAAFFFYDFFVCVVVIKDEYLSHDSGSGVIIVVF